MNCYFCDSIPDSGGMVSVDAAESRHASSSRRQRTGEHVALIDGKGRRAGAKIVSLDRTAMLLRVDFVRQIDRPRPQITLATAVPKGDRHRVLLDMTTQLGIFQYVPLLCDRSVVKPESHSAPRWMRVCIQACKQSHNPYLPRIDQVRSPAEFASSMKNTAIPLYLATPDGVPVLPEYSTDRVAICIGPEGGFSDHEISQLLESGARPVSLGSHVLRIETAAVAAVSIFQPRC